MAQIDPSIAMGFRPAQIPLKESPLNRMQRYAEFENALVKSQEAQRQAAQRNALARIYAKPGLEVGSPEYFKLIQSEVPDYYETAVDKQLKREQLREAKQTSDLRQKELEAKNLDRDLAEFNQVYSPALIRNAEQAKARTKALYAHPTLGARAAKLMPEADALLRTEQEFTNNYEGYIASQYGMTGKDILEAENRRKKELRESAEKSYPAYQLAEFEAGREPLPLDAYVARRTQTTAPASAFAPAVASEPEMVGGTGEMVTLPDGTKQTPAVTKTEKKPISAFGQDVHPLVPSLLAGGNKEMATIVQEGHKATGALRQINDAFRELDRLETEKPKDWQSRSKALRDYIRVVSTEGPGTKVSVGGITLSTEKKYGEKFAGNVADADVALKDAAERAPEAANTANRVLSLLQSGQVITGSAANIKLQMAKLLKLGGGSDSEAITNTEVLISSLADSTLGAIKSSGLGSGQGFTDKDREFLERAKAGQITYEANSLKRLAELAHKAADATANKWNKRVKTIPQSAIEGTGISTEPVTVSPILKTGPRDKTPATNSKGWKLEIDANGNRAYVSPDRKQFEEVK